MKNTKEDNDLLSIIRQLKFEKANELDSLLDKITQNISELLNVDRVGVWIFEGSQTSFSLNCHSLYSKVEKEHFKDLILFQKDYPKYFEALSEQRIIMADNAVTHWATECFADTYLKPLGIKSMYDTPIWIADKVIGVLCLEYFDEKRNWTNEEKYFLTSISDFIGKLFEKNNYLKLIENLESQVKIRTNQLELTLSDLRKTQETIISTEKLTSLGTLTAGIAHEIKNPLNLIANSAKLIENILSTEEMNETTIDDIKMMTEIILSSSKRADHIVKNMMEQSRSDRTFSKEDITPVINDAFKMSFHKMRANIPFEILPYIHIQNTHEFELSKADFKKALINILDNSYYSISEKIKKAKSYSPELSLNAFIDEKQSNYTIEIFDNGMGIKKENLKKVIEPFFTTKNTGSGTGLGLSMAFDIIKKHKGEIYIESQEGENCTVKIHLPLK